MASLHLWVMFDGEKVPRDLRIIRVSNAELSRCLKIAPVSARAEILVTI